jgi:3-oxoacyl-[acyl-carrier-protein] synthase-3
VTSGAISGVRIAGVACAVPASSRKVRDEEWCDAEVAEKIAKSIGISERRVAPESVCTSDLCCEAAERLLAELQWDREQISGLIFITQTPDYVLPATSYSLHHRLHLPDTAYAFDVSLGCSGYVYGLWIAASLMQTGGDKVLLLVGDTISKVASPQDQTTTFVFGDAGSATALELSPDAAPMIFEVGSDGSGEQSLIVPAGGFRYRRDEHSSLRTARENGNLRSDEDLYMDGPEVFTFTLKRVPTLVKSILKSARCEISDIDSFVFHQANVFMLSHLAKRMKIPDEKLVIAFGNYGNTSSASIPLAMVTSSLRERMTTHPTRLLLAGFGVGFSWAGAILNCGPGVFPNVIEYHSPVSAQELTRP